MKIIKFIDFIKEELSDTPEEYIYHALKKLQKSIDSMFDYTEQVEGEEVPEKSIRDAKKGGKDLTKMTFKDLGVQLESSEISKSKLSLTIKFSDNSAFYSLIFKIELKEAIPTDDKSDFNSSDVKKCYVKFKKYDLNTFDIIGQLTKNTEIDKIDDEFIINLKIELDEDFGQEEEEFEIETE